MSALVPATITAFARRLLGLRGTLGQLFGFGADGLPRAVPAGTDGYYLQADSNSADGVSWSAVVIPPVVSEFTAGASEGPNGSTDSRTTGGTSYESEHFYLVVKRPFLKVTAIAVVLPPTSTCTLYINGVSQGSASNATGGHLSTTYTIPAGGIYLPGGEHWISVIRSTGTSAWRDANDSGGEDMHINYGSGDWALKNRIYYGSGLSAFIFTPACQLTYIPYTWAPA